MVEHTQRVMIGVPMTGLLVERWLQKTGPKLHPRAKIAAQMETPPCQVSATRVGKKNRNTREKIIKHH